MQTTATQTTPFLRSQKGHKFWLKVAAVIIGIFGPIFFLGSIEATAEPARWSMDLLSWPLDGQQTFGDPTTRFLSAVTSGFLVGWSVTVWCLSVWVYDLAPEFVRKSVLLGAISWFVFDSTASIISGNPSNAGFNALILMVAIGPMWLPAKT